MRLTSLKKRLGDILVDVGVITPAQLDQALDIQKRGGGKLGTILAQMGVINEEVMLAFLGKQCGVPYVSLSEYGDIPLETVRSVPETVVKSQHLIPIALEGNMVTVAMADPFNIFALDDIKLMTGYDVQVVISSESDISSAIARLYSRAHDATSHALLPSPEPDGIASEKTTELLSVFLGNVLQTGADLVYCDPQEDTIRVRIRRNGVLEELPSFHKRTMDYVLPRLKTMAGVSGADGAAPQEGCFRSTSGAMTKDIRISFVPTIFGERMVLRCIDPTSFQRPLESLGFEQENVRLLQKHIDASRGLVIVTGPPGAGKTTTLYAALYGMKTSCRDIVTIEQPVEHVVKGITQVQIQPGSSESLRKDLHIFMHQHPDVIMVGELSDNATAQCAVQAAQNGRLVLSSITANSTREAMLRIVHGGVDPAILSSVITLVINQRTMRTICPACKESYELHPSLLRGLGAGKPLTQELDRITLWRGAGCRACGFSGYQGVTGIYELVEVNDAFRNMLAKRGDDMADPASIQPAALLTLRDAAWRKVESGVSTVEEMMRVTK